MSCVILQINLTHMSTKGESKYADLVGLLVAATVIASLITVFYLTHNS